ncbi:hypothetical protein DUNSADRAFT_3764 [Dunaliella salina]|uniref:Uncharacterized protein n=1 Tax=Dunaliella salina TaxID=3046 RepID=A0ABQ7GTD4_DUNSA|nr:hypothetical protein DUNSADRAFT_3764 [Dunaliella salina]|eukprot:KAF5837871.1 hypothetical protein DUNSADRAFT_3764 [Dunaliella salina]
MPKGKPGGGSALSGGGQSLGADADDPSEFRAFSDGMTDVTYHTPAWHKARVEALMAPRVTYEDWKLKQKEAEGKMAAVAENEEKNMREYRAMLDADRAKRLSRGTNHPKEEHKKKKSKNKEKDKKKDKRGKHTKKDKKEKDRKKRDKKSKHKKRRRSSSSSSSSSSDDDSTSSSSSSSEDERSSKKRKSGSTTYKRGKDEPVRLSEFLRS